ncbi:MAG TPA: PEP-CTERM sorting domain-containing protein [Acetobacteraceae bacterium]|nr:PEP-CTERM sorting domain-containing protein [Acetobacteraceae bacterium]
MDFPGASGVTQDTPFMRTKYTLTSVAASAVLLSPIVAQARAVSIDFSFVGEQGGTVTGVLYFTNDTGQQTPSAVKIVTASGKDAGRSWNLSAPFTMVPTMEAGHLTLTSGGVIGGFLSLVEKTHSHDAIHQETLHLATSYGAGTINFFLISTLNTTGAGARKSGHLEFTGNAHLPATYSIAAPEPSSIALLGAGIIGIASFSRRRRRNGRNDRVERTANLAA